ncbi:MAG: 50S ribosomal protein L4 [bacterium]|nr:50S ribosomal protein L4 [bacterium]
MNTIPIHTITGEITGEMVLQDELFNAEPNPAVIHEKLVAQLANRRQGTAATKNRALVSGGGAKPWRQKGTGRARAGSNRSPLWVGGGVVFGPQPRSYKQAINKKKTKLALRSVLAIRFREGAILVLERFELPEIKTKQIVSLFKNLNLTGSILVIIEQPNEPLMKSIRNIANTKLLTIQNINVFDLLKYNRIIFTKAALETIQSQLAGAK